MSFTFRVLCNDIPTPAGAPAALLVDETLTVRVDFGEPGDVALATAPLAAHLAPDGAELVINGGHVSGFAKPGAYKLKCTFATGQYRWLEVFVFEQKCLDLLVPEVRHGTGERRLMPQRRMVLRSLAGSPARADGTFDGIKAAGTFSAAEFGG